MLFAHMGDESSQQTESKGLGEHLPGDEVEGDGGRWTND